MMGRVRQGSTRKAIMTTFQEWHKAYRPGFSLRDFYCFEAHVRNARARRGATVPEAWYEFPVFYFSNPRAIYDHEAIIPYPRGVQELDFELEVAAVIGKEGRDIALEEAESHIIGYTIMNDWSARDLQRREVQVGLGPAKGKDFATSLGPALIPPEAIIDKRSGHGFDLKMTARRNGVLISEGNWADIHFSFAQMIVRASQNCTLYPGDVLGSGTVGTGCILELGPEVAGGWLRPDDEIILEIERFGILRNRIGPSL
jgi:fumarylacetoacetate (FAA) hydrolase